MAGRRGGLRACSLLAGLVCAPALMRAVQARTTPARTALARTALARTALARTALARTAPDDRADAWPTTSADGRFAVFSSSDPGLVLGDVDAFADVFVLDETTGAMNLVSVASDSERGNGDSFNPSVSPDGRYVAFWSDASNLVRGDTNGLADLFIHDRWTGGIVRASDVVRRALISNRAVAAGELPPRGLMGSPSPIHAWSWRDVFDEDPDALELLRGSASESQSSPPQLGTIAPPADFELTGPEDGTTANTASLIPISFTWTPSTDQDDYTVELSESPTFANIAFTYSVGKSATNYDVHPNTLDAPQTYYWRVVATNAGGTTLASNSPFHFSVALPASGGGDDTMGFCFIATAAYGSPMEPHVRTLRQFRDRVLMPTVAGRAFINWYYRTSPPLAAAIANDPIRRSVVRGMLWPVVVLASATLWASAHPITATAMISLLLLALAWIAGVSVRDRWRRIATVISARSA